MLDELHIDRGRQGADVAMLMRRVRARLCPDQPPICIGPSATMASGEEGDPAAVVATVASRLFGTSIGPDGVITESLRRATNSMRKPDALTAEIGAALDADPSDGLPDEALADDPLAIWIEMEIGLDDGRTLRRRRSVSLAVAGERPAAQTGRDIGLCCGRIEHHLTMMSRPASARAGRGERAFMAFKLHQFVAGAGHVHATLHDAGTRRVTLEGQRSDPEDGVSRLYPTFFCRACGQEHHPVLLVDGEGGQEVLPRPIDDLPSDAATDGEAAGYLMPEPQGDASFTFNGAPEDYPEDWTDAAASGIRLKSNRRRQGDAPAPGRTRIRTPFQNGPLIVVGRADSTNLHRPEGAREGRLGQRLSHRWRDRRLMARLRLNGRFRASVARRIKRTGPLVARQRPSWDCRRVRRGDRGGRARPRQVRLRRSARAIRCPQPRLSTRLEPP